MQNLPGDIVFRILSTFPPKSICRLRCVCKHWYNSFDPHYFMQIRLKHSITNSSSVFKNSHHESVKLVSPFKDTNRLHIEIVGSCDGLILLKVYCNGWFSKKNYEDYRTESHWLWNTRTEKSKEILNPPQFIYGKNHRGSNVYVPSVTYGVGYNTDTNGHTIVAICSGINNICHGCEVQVYTSESNSWKTLPNMFPYEILAKFDKPEVVFLHGAFHWIARRFGSTETCILSLDIHGENFKEVAQVDRFLNKYHLLYIRTLGVLRGCLCVVLQPHAFCNIEVWVMNNYNVQESWTKLFTAWPQLWLPSVESKIPNYYVKLLWKYKNGEVLFVTGESNGSYSKLVLYDTSREECKITCKIQNIAGNVEAYVDRNPVHKRART